MVKELDIDDWEPPEMIEEEILALAPATDGCGEPESPCHESLNYDEMTTIDPCLGISHTSLLPMIASMRPLRLKGNLIMGIVHIQGRTDYLETPISMMIVVPKALTAPTTTQTSVSIPQGRKKVVSSTAAIQNAQGCPRLCTPHENMRIPTGYDPCNMVFLDPVKGAHCSTHHSKTSKILSFLDVRVSCCNER
ncbi:hypothetical protein AKJ16_DCAP15145 [Drosera capensis]